ncbi:hypothetical protein [Pseudomonas arsenicoxydans]|uniref:hypothetical protein n=1 Tax=Pseudomonas arsenicoxydans TaxID=702115 RepID=UPI001E46E94A|nr:hypothetical protein [Pseudomonas arsenicoxydans]
MRLTHPGWPSFGLFQLDRPFSAYREGLKTAIHGAVNTADQMTETPASVAALLKDGQSRTHTMTSTVLIVEDDEILRSLTVDAIS